jgi:hypothetical protein
MLPTANCEVCGKAFYASPGHLANGWGRFCSLECRTVLFQGEKHPSWKTGGDCVCLACGKSFHAKMSHIANGESKYCSLICRQTAYNRQIERICEYCGVKFMAYQAYVNKGGGKFCTRTCAGASKSTKVTRTCKECGAPFLIKKCALKQEHKLNVGAFCSMKCKARAMSHYAARGGRYKGLGGAREDLGGLYVRSSWEANWARYLNWLKGLGEILTWEYEADTFEFPIKRGSKFYTPDFKVTNKDGSIEYHEVKGWMNQQSATKIKRMGNYYPRIKLIVVDSNAYHEVGRQLGQRLPGWESSGHNRW